MHTYGQHIRTEEDGSHELYPFDYLEFYASHIHPYDEIKMGEKSKRIYEGITASEFRQAHKDGFLNVVSEVLQNITFTHKDGTTVESSSETLIKEIRNALEANKECDAHTYQVEKIVTWDKVANNSVMQSYFVHDLSVFLNQYFPVKRKKDAQVSTKEVELILYLMKLFGLSKEELTNKRYWQLMNTYKRINKHVTDVGEFTIDGKPLIIPLRFIPYSIWSNGKIDWTDNDLPRFEGETGCTIKF